MPEMVWRAKVHSRTICDRFFALGFEETRPTATRHDAKSPDLTCDSNVRSGLSASGSYVLPLWILSRSAAGFMLIETQRLATSGSALVSRLSHHDPCASAITDLVACIALATGRKVPVRKSNSATRNLVQSKATPIFTLID
jgi:hypothetical protein